MGGKFERSDARVSTGALCAVHGAVLEKFVSLFSDVLGVSRFCGLT